MHITSQVSTWVSEWRALLEKFLPLPATSLGEGGPVYRIWFRLLFFFVLLLLLRVAEINFRWFPYETGTLYHDFVVLVVYLFLTFCLHIVDVGEDPLS